MALNFVPLLRAFFGLRDYVDLHCIDCRLFSRSYVNTKLSSQVIMEFNKSGSLSLRWKRSKHNSLRRSFCSTDSSFGTIFAQTFLMFSSSDVIRRTLPLSKLTSSATARAPNLRSLRITSRTFSVFSSVTAVRGRPGRSSSHAFPAFRKSFYAIQTRVQVSFADFFSFTRNLITPSLLQSDIFRPSVRTRLYFRMHTHVLSKAIELSILIL